MKFAIDSGHGAPGDGGAHGIKSEESLINSVGSLIKRKLQALGHTVVECRPSYSTGVNNSLYRRCQTANNAGVDVFVSLHFNCFNGSAHGTEVYAISPKGKSIAQSVLNEIVKLGFHNRGVKNKRFYVLRNTNAPAILIEGCFIDSQRDMALFNSEKMATAIVEGLTGSTLGCTCD